MSEMFLKADRFDRDIGGWSVGKVKDMTDMFALAVRFSSGSQGLARWGKLNTAEVKMEGMFSGASAFCAGAEKGGWFESWAR